MPDVPTWDEVFPKYTRFPPWVAAFMHMTERDDRPEIKQWAQRRAKERYGDA